MNLSFSQNYQKIRIEPSKIIGGNTADFFKEVIYIPLETNKECLFGDISNFMVTENSFIIEDADTKAIYFFDIHGKFLNKVKLGINKYLTSYNKRKQVLTITFFNYNGEVKKQLLFTNRGTYVSLSPTQEFNILEDLLYLGYGIYAGYGQNIPPVDSGLLGYHIVLFDSLLRPVKPLIRYTLSPFLTFSHIAGYQRVILNDTKFLLSTPFDHFLYEVNKDTAILKWQFVFPTQQSISSSVVNLKSKESIDSLIQAEENKRTLITSISNIYYSGKFYYFHINRIVFSPYRSSSEELNQYNFLYFPEVSQVTSLERVVSDKSNWYMPLSSHTTTILGLLPVDGYLYSTVSSLQMFAAREATKNKNPQYPPVLQEYFKTQSRKSNPVIVKMKLKDF